MSITSAQARRPFISEPEDMPYGERQYGVIDSGGRLWTFSETIAEVASQEWGGTPARAACG